MPPTSPVACEHRADLHARPYSAGTVRSLAQSRSAATFSAIITASGRVAAISELSRPASGAMC